LRGPRGPTGFYGWHIAGWSTLLVAATAPGQTAAISVLVDPLIADLSISRSAVSAAYLVGTLAGAVMMPILGRAIDAFGPRRVIAAIGLVFSGALFALSSVTSLASLTGSFVLIRMAGQGALGLAATTLVAHWFTRRRGTVLGVVSAIGTSAISLTPVLIEGLVIAHGWRHVLRLEAAAILLIVLPVAVLALRDRPGQLGQHPDGVPPPTTTSDTDGEWGVTRAIALRSPFFWLVTSGVATSGLLSTAINFHQISLLTARGLTQTEAAANFLPQTAATLGATLVTGWLADRMRATALIAAAMLTLTAALLLGVIAAPGLLAISFGALLGAAGGAIRALEAAAFPRHFGTRHLGAIRGVVTAVSVGSTAFGPLLFAALHSTAHSYTLALLTTATLPLLVSLTALTMAIRTRWQLGGADSTAADNS
jgi:MFS family permease